MRRKDRQIGSFGEIEAILSETELGYLASCGADGMPMCTPLNYVYYAGKIYFHCALSGRKLDNIRQNPKVGFTVVMSARIDRVNMTTYYSSVMVEGRARVVDDPGEKAAIIGEITRRLAAPGEECNDKAGARMAIVEITADSISGKRNVPR